MRALSVIAAAAAATFSLYASSASACCGKCEGDHHHNAAPTAAATPETEMTATKPAATGDAAVLQPVTLEPARLVVYKATLGDPAAAWNMLPGLAGAQGLLGDDTHAWSVVPTMPDMNDMEGMASLPYWAAFTISAEAQPTGELEVYTSPGGKYLQAVHVGPYEKLGVSWEKFAGLVLSGQASAEYDASRPMLENYVSDPGNTPQEDLITHLYIPVK